MAIYFLSTSHLPISSTFDPKQSADSAIEDSNLMMAPPCYRFSNPQNIAMGTQSQPSAPSYQQPFYQANSDCGQSRSNGANLLLDLNNMERSTGNPQNPLTAAPPPYHIPTESQYYQQPLRHTKKDVGWPTGTATRPSGMHDGLESSNLTPPQSSQPFPRAPPRDVGRGQITQRFRFQNKFMAQSGDQLRTEEITKQQTDPPKSSSDTVYGVANQQFGSKSPAPCCPILVAPSHDTSCPELITIGAANLIQAGTTFDTAMLDDAIRQCFRDNRVTEAMFKDPIVIRAVWRWDGEPMATHSGNKRRSTIINNENILQVLHLLERDSPASWLTFEPMFSLAPLNGNQKKRATTNGASAQSRKQRKTAE